MRLTPSERDRLLLFTAAELARARLARGTRLNVPEATALVADTVIEAARDGARRAAAIEAGRSVLTERQVLPGVVDLVPEVWVEAGFDDGTRLVVVGDPFRAGPGGADGSVSPGAVLPGTVTPAEPVWSDPVPVEVENTASVPVHVTSHMHFFEVNPALRFDRAAAYGRRLAIEAGTSVRFDAGSRHRVRLVPFGGDRVLVGFAGLVDGPLDAPGAFEQALERARACGYLDAGSEGPA